MLTYLGRVIRSPQLLAVGGTLMRPDGTAIFPLDVGTYAADVLPTIAARAGFAERLHAGGGA